MSTSAATSPVSPTRAACASESVYNEVDWLVETTEAASGATADHDPEGLAPALGYKTVYLYDEIGQLVEERAVRQGDDGTELHAVGAESRAGGTPRGEAGGDGDWRLDLLPARVRRELQPDDDHRPRGRGRLPSRTFDERNLLDSVTRGSGTPEAVAESYAYDSEGNRTLFTDGRGNAHATAFDGFGRVKSATDPLGNRTAMTYDNGSNVISSKSLDGGGALLAASGTTFAPRAAEVDGLAAVDRERPGRSPGALDVDHLRRRRECPLPDRPPGPRFATGFRRRRAAGGRDRSDRQPDGVGAR